MSLARAIETGDLSLLPSRRDEDWRWTDLRALVRELPPRSPAAAVATSTPGPFDVLADRRLDLMDAGSGRIDVPAGVAQVWRVAFEASPTAGSHVATLAVDVGEGASLVLLETYGGASSAYVAEADLAISLARGARLERIVLAEDGEMGVCVSRAEVTISAVAAFAQTVLTRGARRQRIETRVAHPGASAAVRLDGVYLLNGRRHADITTVVDHVGAGGVTDQLIKGVVDDQARGVFQGRIAVARGADQTDARMGHHALILSDRAEVDAKPELEIYADDVACAHGNTVGALDEAALFYAAQRGIPEREARALLTAAFVGEVVDRIEHPGAREVARSWVERRLGGEP
jgi:Fe-S cluster assembly protein SufD